MIARDPWLDAQDQQRNLFHDIVTSAITGIDGEHEVRKEVRKELELSFTAQSGFRRTIRSATLWTARHKGVYARCCFAREKNIAGKWLSWIDVGPEQFASASWEARAVVACQTMKEAKALARWRYSELKKGNASKVQIKVK